MEPPFTSPYPSPPLEVKPTVTLPSWATLTTILGSVLAVAIGFADAKTGSQLGQSFDVGLIAAGVGALVGTNPRGANAG